MKWPILTALIFFGCAKSNYQDAPANPTTFSTPPCELSFQEKKCSMSLATENICMDIEWEKFQEGKQKGSFFICSYDRTMGVRQNMSLNPFVELWMPSMNHGSAPTKTEAAISTGVYRVKDVYFVMSGQWEIRIQIKEGSTIQAQAVLPITVEKK